MCFGHASHSFVQQMTDSVMCLCSMFVLKSCEGFAHDSFHVYCCAKRICLTYTQDALIGLGYKIEGSLDLLTCHQGTDNASVGAETETAGVTSISSARHPSMAAIAAYLLFVIALIQLVLDII